MATATYSASQTASDLGLKSTDYNYLMGQTGLFLGILFCFFVLASILQISRGR